MELLNHIETLKAAYGKIEKINPHAESTKKLERLVSSHDDATLNMLEAAGIRWISNLATVELMKRKWA